MSKEASTPSSVLNSKVRGKKIEFNEDDKNLISNALSLIWVKTNKKVESCLFERNKATVCCNKSGRVYFDLVEELSLVGLLENKELQEKETKESKKKSNNLSIELERYKSRCELLSSQNTQLKNELRQLQPLHNSCTSGTMDTIVSDSVETDELNELNPEQLNPESPTSTVGSVFYQDANNLDLARIVNCDLAFNNLTTTNTPEEIWTNLNKRCIEKFGEDDNIKRDVVISDITWACTTLPAYVSWNWIVDYHNDVKRWIAKIEDFSSKNSEESEALPTTPSPAETASQSLAPSKRTKSQLAASITSSIPPSSTETMLQSIETSITSDLTLAAPETTSQPPAVLGKTTSQLPATSGKTTQKKRKIANYNDTSSDDEDDEDEEDEEDEEDVDYIDDTKSKEVITKQQILNSTQLLLYRKGKKLREILLNSQESNEVLTDPEHSKLGLNNVITELSAMPIKVVDLKTAEDRILQWKKQEAQCDTFRIAAESYNLLHLMSLVQVYEDLIKIGEKLKTDPSNGIKNISFWVIGFMRDKLNINKKAEQRNRLGCNRLRKLFSEGITCAQLAKSGLRKCDFFAKKEDYEVFLSQIPSLETRHSISSSSSSNERLSDVLGIVQPYMEIFNDSVPAASRSKQKKEASNSKQKKKARFLLDLRNFEDVADKDCEYIIT